MNAQNANLNRSRAGDSARHRGGGADPGVARQITPLYRVLLHSLPVRRWEVFLTAVRQQTALDPTLRELIILRVAVLNRADYEYRRTVPPPGGHFETRLRP
jgi:alkylhydroperoxidase family enzyme